MIFFRLKRTIKLGFKSLTRHMLRSVLTMLGIVFGVGAVVAMLAVGEGASYESQERIKRLGSLNIIINSVKLSADEQSSNVSNFTAVYGLKYTDAEIIKSTLPQAEVILRMRAVRKDVFYLNRQMNSNIISTVPWYADVTNQKLKKGRFFTTVDMRSKLPVCVIGAAVEKRLFPYEESLSKQVRFENNTFSVIGVLASAGSESDSEETEDMTDVDSAILIPLTTSLERFGDIRMERKSGSFIREQVELHRIVVKVKSVDDVVPTSEVISALLEKTHVDKDYEIIVPLQMLQEIQRNARMFSWVLGMIAAISLLVGGIGIMNIMLASVTERTREIGIRRALGAKKRDIIIQFLSETMVLSLVGGVLGLGLGIGLPKLIEMFTDMKIIFTAWSLILSFSISAAVGLVFGLYPAWRAAGMDPIEALRHE